MAYGILLRISLQVPVYIYVVLQNLIATKTYNNKYQCDIYHRYLYYDIFFFYFWAFDIIYKIWQDKMIYIAIN